MGLMLKLNFDPRGCRFIFMSQQLSLYNKIVNILSKYSIYFATFGVKTFFLFKC